MPQPFSKSSYTAQLKAFIAAHHELMQILQALREIEAQAYLAAGVIRNSIWAQLHGQAYPLHQTEIDVVYFDAQENGTGEQQIRRKLETAFPDMLWDVVNQARVHHWYRMDNGNSIAPFSSLAQALAVWPETATAVAVQLDASGQLKIIAPLGLQDLFELKLRWNPAMVSYAVFQRRLNDKAFLTRWPELQLISS